MKRVYWKEAVQEEKQKEFLEYMKEKSFGLWKEVKELSFTLTKKSGERFELYVPRKDFEED